MKLKLITLCASLVAINCASGPVVKAQKDRLAGLKKIALLGTVIESPDSPSFPIADAAIFNSKFKGVAADIDKTSTEVIDGYRDNVAGKLSSELSSTVATGVKLAQSKEYQAIIKEGLQDFPVSAYKSDFSVVQASAEKNFFNAEKGQFGKYFESADMAKHASYFCEKLKVDAIAFSINRLIVTSVGPFGIGGSATLHTQVIVFDKTGAKVLDAQTSTDPVGRVSGGGDSAGFASILQTQNHAKNLEAIFAKLKEQKDSK